LPAGTITAASVPAITVSISVSAAISGIDEIAILRAAFAGESHTENAVFGVNHDLLIVLKILWLHF
jgi:hypothetical protein